MEKCFAKVIPEVSWIQQRAGFTIFIHGCSYMDFVLKL
jgi:hypothetical protein